MSILKHEELLFVPESNFMTIRDYTLVGKPGFTDALRVAHTEVAASNGSEIAVVCAQDLLNIRVSVEIHEHRPRRKNDSEWQDAILFQLPFPTANLWVGDAFGEGVVIDLPSSGQYAVDVLHRGREEAATKAREVLSQFSSMPYPEGNEWLKQWNGIEHYLIIISTISDGVAIKR